MYVKIIQILRYIEVTPYLIIWWRENSRYCSLFQVSYTPTHIEGVRGKVVTAQELMLTGSPCITLHIPQPFLKSFFIMKRKPCLKISAQNQFRLLRLPSSTWNLFSTAAYNCYHTWATTLTPKCQSYMPNSKRAQFFFWYTRRQEVQC